MNQIRDIYNKSKLSAKDKPQKITKQLCTRVIALINKEANNMEADNDFSHIQELLMYREKYQLVSSAYDQRLKKQELYLRIRAIFQDHSLEMIKQRQKQQDLGYFDTKSKQISKSKVGFQQIMGSVPIVHKKFNKKPQHQPYIFEEKVGSSNLLQNDKENELKEQIRRLKDKLHRESEHDQRIYNTQQQIKNFQKQIHALQRQIERIKNENASLKESLKNKIKFKTQGALLPDQQSQRQQKSQKQQKSQRQERQQMQSNLQFDIYRPQQIEKYFYNPPKYIYKQPFDYWQQSKKEQVNHYPKVKVKQEIPKHIPEITIKDVPPAKIMTNKHNNYERPNHKYQINYLPNNIRTLTDRLHDNSQEQKSNQLSQRFFVKKLQQPVKKIPSPLSKKNEKDTNVNDLKKQYKEISIKQKHQKDKQVPKNVSSSLLFKTSSNHKFNKSQVYDEAKNIAVRSKISFFKSSMIIFRDKDFQVAVKTIDQQRLLSKRILIYINNKESIGRQVKLTFKFNPDYYEIKFIKKASFIEAKSQEKQELFVKLLNSDDFDNIIEVELTFNTKTIHFLIPTMFISFIEKRPNRSKRTQYQKQKIQPIHQYSNIHLAREIIPIEIIHGQPYQTGRLYAISRYYEGYIYFRWIQGRLEVETIPPWKLFIAYLLLKDL